MSGAADRQAFARWIAIAVALLIAWGSLYPLDFLWLDDGALAQRLLHAGSHTLSRTDWIANLLLYMPFGAICALAVRGGGCARRVWRATAAGATLSFALELIQLATPHRVTSLLDWASNAAGALAGALVAEAYLQIGGPRRIGGLRDPRPAFVPSFLLVIWFVGEFAPYLPTHHALPLGRLIAQMSAAHAYSAARMSIALARWWIIAECLRHVWRRPWAMPGLALLIALTLAEQSYVDNDRRGVEELASWCIVPVLALLTSRWPARARAWWTIAACGAVLWTTNAWTFAPLHRVGVFHWIPFSGTLLTSRDYRPLLDIVFFYGALLWSLTLALRILAAAFVLTFTSSIAVELAHLWTPPHRAEVTNPLLVIGLVAAFALGRRFQSYAFGIDGPPGPVRERAPPAPERGRPPIHPR